MRKPTFLSIALIVCCFVVILFARPAGSAVDCNRKPDHPKCIEPDDGDDTTSGGKHPSLRLTFDTAGNIQAVGGVYVDKEGAGVSAGGQTQPNAAGIAFTPKHKAKNPRFVYLDIQCVDILDPINDLVVASCDDFPERLEAYFLEHPDLIGPFARCPTPNNCSGIHLKLRPYEVNCPGPGDEPCPSIYTMSPGSGNTEQMSYRVGFGSGLLIEIASDIGGASSPNPGRCLSFLGNDARTAFIAACETSGNCNVTVEAFDDGSFTGAGFEDGENDSWTVTADDATALICDRQTSTVLGTATMSFSFDAIKKD